MKSIEKIKLNPLATIREAIEVIDKGSMQIALVVDHQNKLIGTLTDGDIRRGLLDGLTLESTIESIIFRTPTIAKVGASKKEILNLATAKKLHQIPIVDDEGKVVGIEEIDELVKPEQRSNKVVLMAGGLGTRLRPLTEHKPKPMLEVGNKPILQTIIEHFASYGFRDFVIVVNYKSHVIQEYFNDGSNLGVNIEYIQEEKRLGTAGSLSLLKEIPEEPFFVMNADILTNLNFLHLYNYHVSSNSVATMCVREYEIQIPYGVINIDNTKILSIEEKPIHKFFINAGIYVLSPEVLGYLPKKAYFDMPLLFEKLIKDGKNVISFPIRELWIDIGHMEEYKKANEIYKELFNV